MLNGDESCLELYAAKVAEGYRPPLLKGLPPSLVDVIQACWKGDAELRPTAREVVALLEAVRDSGEWHRCVRAWPAGWIRRQRRRQRLHSACRTPHRRFAPTLLPDAHARRRGVYRERCQAGGVR